MSEPDEHVTMTRAEFDTWADSAERAARFAQDALVSVVEMQRLLKWILEHVDVSGDEADHIADQLEEIARRHRARAAQAQGGVRQ